MYLIFFVCVCVWIAFKAFDVKMSIYRINSNIFYICKKNPNAIFYGNTYINTRLYRERAIHSEKESIFVVFCVCVCRLTCTVITRKKQQTALNLSSKNSKNREKKRKKAFSLIKFTLFISTEEEETIRTKHTACIMYACAVCVCVCVNACTFWIWKRHKHSYTKNE